MLELLIVSLGHFDYIHVSVRNSSILYMVHLGSLLTHFKKKNRFEHSMWMAKFDNVHFKRILFFLM